MSEIKERPILFSASMVRAILEDRKTVTRREVKKRAALDCLASGFEPAFLALPGNADLCPYGKPGDRLWVRETWYCDHFDVQQGPYLQPADMTDLDEARENGDLVYAADGLTPYEQDQPKWKPSIHMPRWASRILLEITDVRVERLQDISEDQAQAEGVRGIPRCRSLYPTDDYRFPFKDLWGSINGASAWDTNPWVWAVSFRRVNTIKE